MSTTRSIITTNCRTLLLVATYASTSRTAFHIQQHNVESHECVFGAVTFMRSTLTERQDMPGCLVTSFVTMALMCLDSQFDVSH